MAWVHAKDLSKHEPKQMGYEGKEFEQEYSSGSIVGICTEVYPDYMAAKVDSYFLQEPKILPYYPDSGVRVGSTVRIEVTSNIPRITKVLTFGEDVDKSLILDLDGKREDDKVKYLYTIKDKPDWDVPESEKGPTNHIIIKHKEGEKIYSMDLGGLKLGRDKVSLFYHAGTRLNLSRRAISVQSESIYAFSKGGNISMNAPIGGGYGLISESVHDVDSEDNAFEFIREFKGDVARGLRDDNIEILRESMPSSVQIDNSVYLFIILDDDVEKYKTDGSIVSHEYRNRELSIEGEKKERPINKDLMQKAELDQKVKSSSAAICKINGNEFPITYIKSIDREGNVYEFNAGEKTSIKNDFKDITHKNRDDIVFGNYFLGYQSNYESRQYPVLENTSIMHEFFGDHLVNYKGKTTENRHKQSYFTNIHTITRYEVDPDSPIDTVDLYESPLPVRKYTKKRETYEENDVIQEEPQNTKVISFNNNKTTIREKTGSDSYMVASSIQGKESLLVFSPVSAIIKTEGTLNVSSKDSVIKSDRNQIEGKTFFEDGIFVEGDFTIKAENIFLEAKRTFMTKAQTAFFQIEKNYIVQYKENFQIVNSETVIDGNKSLLSSGIFLGKTSVNIQGETAYLYGQKSITAVADKTASYGAEKTSIAGYGE